MYCPNCGSPNPDGARFCSGCGSALQSPPQPPAPPPQQNVIDLRGVANTAAPAEKADMGAILAAVLMVVGWILFILGGSAFAESTGVNYRDDFGQKLLVVATLCVPIFAIGYPIARILRNKANLPKLEKGPMLTTGGFCWLITACVTALTFIDIIAAPGLGDLVMIVLVFFSGALGIGFIVFAGTVSSQFGKAVRYQLLTGYFFSFLPGALLGYLLATLVAAMGFLMIIGLVILVAFFANGGILLYRSQS